MLKSKAIELLGGTVPAAAEAIGITYQAVNKWPETLKPRIADRVMAAVARANPPSCMASSIPSAAELREALEALTHSQVVTLAERSGVPFTTLWKIRGGETTNPRLETVRQFMPHVALVAAA